MSCAGSPSTQLATPTTHQAAAVTPAGRETWLVTHTHTQRYFQMAKHTDTLICQFKLSFTLRPHYKGKYGNTIIKFLDVIYQVKYEVLSLQCFFNTIQCLLAKYLSIMYNPN